MARIGGINFSGARPCRSVGYNNAPKLINIALIRLPFYTNPCINYLKIYSRSKFIIDNWSTISKEKSTSSGPFTLFQTVVKQAIEFIKPSLFNDDTDLPHPVPDSHLVENLLKELEQFLTTGKSSAQEQDSARNRHANVTLLQPITGKWFTHCAACPFVGFAPLPLKELDRSGDQYNRVAFEYCRTELKKILLAFRKRKETVKFFFNLRDPLVFCYQDSPLSFDVVDCPSFLVDHVGLANLLKAAARKLRSNQSTLFTESMAWPLWAKDVAGYLQTVLCCPLSLIPTIYGLRLMDNVELGPDSFISTRNPPKPFSRLGWKKAQLFKGVALTMSSQLEQCLERLKKLCFLVKTPSIGRDDKVGIKVFSPLTFCYVLSDLIHRGGLPASTMEAFPPPSIFRASMEANQAWMEGRDVWRVTAYLSVSKTIDLDLFWKIFGTTPLRLLLMPHSAAIAVFNHNERLFDVIYSTDSHFFDNFSLSVKMNEDGISMDSTEVSFLLADRNLLKTHCGFIVDHDQKRRIPLFVIGRFRTDCSIDVDKFSPLYPWPLKEESNLAVSDRSNKLLAMSCQESKDAYTIRFNVCAAGYKQPRAGRS